MISTNAYCLCWEMRRLIGTRGWRDCVPSTEVGFSVARHIQRCNPRNPGLLVESYFPLRYSDPGCLSEKQARLVKATRVYQVSFEERCPIRQLGSMILGLWIPPSPEDADTIFGTIFPPRLYQDVRAWWGVNPITPSDELQSILNEKIGAWL